MRAHLLAGSLGLLALVTPLALGACSASGAGGAASVDTTVAPTSPAPAPSGKAADGGADADSAPPPPANDCKLPELPAVADVTPTFFFYDAAVTVPPVMTGGTLAGNYIVDKATVYLPSGSVGLADPKKSLGTINAWASFDGTNYRLSLKADLTISTVIGPQSQGTSTVSQGGFVVSGAALTLDHACDTAIAQEADYSFTDKGAGRATILIKTPSPYGDTYMQLDAAKN